MLDRLCLPSGNVAVIELTGDLRVSLYDRFSLRPNVHSARSSTLRGRSSLASSRIGPRRVKAFSWQRRNSQSACQPAIFLGLLPPISPVLPGAALPAVL